jgi:hypothetical protein
VAKGAKASLSSVRYVDLIPRRLIAFMAATSQAQAEATKPSWPEPVDAEGACSRRGGAMVG